MAGHHVRGEGGNVMSESSNDALEDARRYVRRKRIFVTVLGIWLALSLMWFLIDLSDDSSSYWFYWPMLGTGIAVAITGIILLGIGGLFGADGSAGRSTGISAAEGTSQGRDDELAVKGDDAEHAGPRESKTMGSPSAAREPMKTKAWRARRWFLLAGGVFGFVIAAVLGVYGWAWSSTDESTIARAMIWRESDVGDQHRFPARRIPAGARTSPLRAGVEADLVVSGEGKGLDGFLRETDTLAFLVVHEDRLVRELYFGGANRESLQTSFSAAKSFVSTLVGIAIDEGLIESIEDRVTDYVPELAERIPGSDRSRCATCSRCRLASATGRAAFRGPSVTTRTRTTEWTSATSP